MKKIEIDSHVIGDGEPVFIIAEAGINHNGSISLAKQLIRKAADACADAIKFQMFKAEEFCSYKSDYFSLFKDLEFNESEWYELADYCRCRGIIFTASVFGQESANLLEKIDSPIYKIASGDLTYHPLLSFVSLKNKPIILSTGMATIGEIKEAISVIYEKGNDQIALLHCISNYPLKHEEANLMAIQSLKKIFKIPIGFSDHSTGLILPLVAVSLGANILEKHFTTNKKLSGPDHAFSLNPQELKEMVGLIKIVEASMGDGNKNPTPDEHDLKINARRSLVAKNDILKGTTIGLEDIKVVRPGRGIPPKFISHVKGKTAKKNILKDDLITWDAI